MAVTFLAGSLIWAEEWRSDFGEGAGKIDLIPAENWEAREGKLQISEAGKPKGPVRRPVTYALLPDRWRDAELTVEARSLEPDSKVGKDIVLLFGYQDAEHFYYAHVSNDSDGRTHSIIMRVEASGRTPIHLEEAPEPALGSGWQTLRVSHGANGEIVVRVDEREEPVLTANDTSYPAGRMGFGSFNDTAEFDEARIVGDRLAD